MTDIYGLGTEYLEDKLAVKMVNLQGEYVAPDRKKSVAPEAIQIAFELRQRGDLDEDKFMDIVKVCNEYIPTSGTR